MGCKRSSVQIWLARPFDLGAFNIIAEIKKEAEKYFSHPPEVPVQLVDLLTEALLNLPNKPRDFDCELYLLPIVLLQMGLDIHDNFNSDDDMSILEGDYYCSLFYKLFTKDEALVAILPQIIMEISALHQLKLEYQIHKCTVYEQYIKRVKSGIAVALLKSLCNDEKYIAEWSTKLEDSLFLAHEQKNKNELVLN